VIISWITRRAPWLLTALVLAMLVPGTATVPLIDRDEPRFATATREMIERADWVVPTFNGNYRFDKPVLTYWLMRAGYAIFGVGEFGARVHAIAAALVLVLTTWWVGRRWFNERVGLAAGAMLATCLQVFIHGRLALADMPMIACVVLACVAVKELLEAPVVKPFRSAWWWWLYLALGVGFLAKGPIVLAVPLLGLLLFRFVFWRKPLAWGNLGVVPGLVVSLAIVACWGIPALVRTHGLFWKVGMGEHVVQRGFDRFNGRGYTPFFYLGTAPVSLFPWIAFVVLLPFVARRFWGDRNAWLVSWLIAPYVIFTAYATQLPHYVLPAFPALFLLLAQAVVMERSNWPAWSRRVSAGMLGFFTVLFAIGLAVVLITPLPVEAQALRGAFAGVCLVMCGFCAMAWSAWLGAFSARAATINAPTENRINSSAEAGGGGGRALLFGLGILLAAPGALLMGRGLRATGITVQLSDTYLDVPPGLRFLGAGFSEPSLIFYTHHNWVFPQTAEDLEKQLAVPGPVVLATVKEECDPLKFFAVGLQQRLGKPAEVKMRSGPAELVPVLEQLSRSPEWKVREIVGFNLGRTRWQHVQIWQRE
jgi:4-amino-4-deoxy-L-arabinose transferase-like glycosyltransferase